MKPFSTVNSLQSYPKETATHLAISALAELLSRDSGTSFIRYSSMLLTQSSWDGLLDRSKVTEEALRAEIENLVGTGVELPTELDDAIGEVYVLV